jgi:hypothetical protein
MNTHAEIHLAGEMALAKRRVKAQLDRVVSLAESGHYAAEAELVLEAAEGALAALERSSAWQATVPSTLDGLLDDLPHANPRERDFMSQIFRAPEPSLQ